jgi:TolB-like protein
MAPEQAAADPDIDHRADIYAVGITAYEMLTGQPPFAGMNPRAMLAARMTQDPPYLGAVRTDVPRALAELVMRCLAREPADRPATAAEILAALDDPAMASGAFASSERRHGGLRSRSGWLARAATLVAVAALAGMGAWSVMRRGSSAVPAVPAAAAAAPIPLSVVVLPLVNIGMDSANNAVADGITSELAAALGRVHGVRVVSPSRAAQLLKAGKSASEVGEALHVTMQLEGTIQRDGRRLRVTARLVEVSDGTMRWSDMYERETTDLMTVQDELSRAITLAVGEVMRGTV